MPARRTLDDQGKAQPSVRKRDHAAVPVRTRAEQPHQLEFEAERRDAARRTVEAEPHRNRSGSVGRNVVFAFDRRHVVPRHVGARLLHRLDDLLAVRLPRVVACGDQLVDGIVEVGRTELAGVDLDDRVGGVDRPLALRARGHRVGPAERVEE
jgi:hypothetical protein